jgi:hypothetical protein
LSDSTGEKNACCGQSESAGFNETVSSEIVGNSYTVASLQCNGVEFFPSTMKNSIMPIHALKNPFLSSFKYKKKHFLNS